MVGLSSSIKQIGSIMAIDHVNLSRVDLNLLVALDALLTERSVTRAAARVGLGQSAMSSNLARLRTLFGDELLTRGPEGMRLTPRALALVDPVRITLAQITALVSRDDTFDARIAERLFRIGLPDSAEVLLGPALPTSARPHPVSSCACTPPTGCSTNSTPTASTLASVSDPSRRDRRTTNGVCSV